MAQNKIIKKINVNIENCKKIVKDKDVYNKKVKLVKKYTKAGIVASYLVPYVITLPILTSIKIEKGNNPFVKDMIPVAKTIEVIDTSNGTHIEHISDDYKYDETNFEYSTGWKINENGLYERQLVEYKINDDYNFDDVEEIFSMSKEEIDNIFDIDTYKTICKKTLEPEDYYYDEDGFIITNHVESTEKVLEKESTGDYIFNLLSILFASFCLGSLLNLADEMFNLLLYRARKNMKNYQNSYNEVNVFDVEIAQKLLKINQDNMDLLTDNLEEDEEYKKFVLRRKSGE